MVRMGTAEGVAFTNTGKETAITLVQGDQKKKSPVDRSKITCHECGGPGHFANECLETEKDGAPKKDATALVNKGIKDGEFEEGDHVNFLNRVQFMQQHSIGTTMHMTLEGGRVTSSWILLNNQSTVDVFHNAKLLTNVRKSENDYDLDSELANKAKMMIDFWMMRQNKIMADVKCHNTDVASKPKQGSPKFIRC
jgi:hypothetical protein